MDFPFPKITIITGHYGCGKTNVAVNIALRLAAEGKRVTVVDLDIVNPYFRTADFGELFADRGIDLVVPMYANSNLDIPALSFDLGAIINGGAHTVIDVGGDPEGAIALGRYGGILKNRTDLALYYVINKYRYLTSTPEEALELLEEIKQASGLDCSGIINNSNLGRLTDSKTVAASADYAEQIAKAARVPLLFTCSEAKNLMNIENAMETEIYVKPLWEQ
ncbi:MAG: P-loop NTPase [Firmicutes bacterium]|nr:P-loop NTPase [[Eubacterium] siraeum]MCM1487366.1 P-loop NTPase [Bacillota bacterium]